MPDVDLNPEICLTDQIACVRRELHLRVRVYPRQVATGRLTNEKATKEIAAMAAVLRTLEQVAGGRPDLFPDHHGVPDNERAAQPG
jgi:hypothetical protein